MRLSIADFREYAERRDAVGLMAAYTTTSLNAQDTYIASLAAKQFSRSIVARTEEGEFMGFAMGVRAWQSWDWLRSIQEASQAQYFNAWVIAEIHVVPKFKRMRVGSMLLWDCECQSPHRDWSILGVDMENVPARRLYGKSEWTDTGLIFQPSNFTRKQILYEKDLSDHPPIEFTDHLMTMQSVQSRHPGGIGFNPPAPSLEPRPSPQSPAPQTA